MRRLSVLPDTTLSPAERLSQVIGRVRLAAEEAERLPLKRELARIADELVALHKIWAEADPEPSLGSDAWGRAKHPAPGQRVCSQCRLPKPLKAYGWSDKGRRKLRAECKDCYNAGQRTRYVRAGYRIVTVEVMPGDPCIGHKCPGCRQPFKVGDHIQGENVHHEACWQ